MTLFERFRQYRIAHPDQTAFMAPMGDRYLSITWKKFTDDIALVAEVIREHATGKVVALLGENSYEWVVAHAACLFAGAVAVPVDGNLHPEDIVARLEKVKAATLVYSSLFRERASQVKSLMPGLALARFSNIKTDSFLNLAGQRLREGCPSIWDEGFRCDSERVSMLVFTSGTTSEPKAVMHSLRSLEAFCEFAMSRLSLKAGSRSMMILPLQHIFGICTTYLMLAFGVQVGICPDFRHLYSAVERFRVDFLFLVPALAEILAQKIKRHADTCRGALGHDIEFVLTGGAHLPQGVRSSLEELGIRVISAYGLTETCSLYSMDFSSSRPPSGTAGAAVMPPFGETRVSETGELLLKSPAVFKGYYADDKATARVLSADGWFSTGDLGTIDAAGDVRITGRKSRVLVFDSGKKVSPEELESKLLQLACIEEVFVCAETSSRVITAEVFSHSPSAEVERAVDTLNRKLPVYMRIRRVRFRDTPFPRTASGKIIVGK